MSWDKRYELLQFIWGKHDFFNDLFILLSRGLSTLNFANMAYVGFDALVPREVSIIDVSRYSRSRRVKRNGAGRMPGRECEPNRWKFLPVVSWRI